MLYTPVGEYPETFNYPHPHNNDCIFYCQNSRLHLTHAYAFRYELEKIISEGMNSENNGIHNSAVSPYTQTDLSHVSTFWRRPGHPGETFFHADVIHYVDEQEVITTSFEFYPDEEFFIVFYQGEKLVVDFRKISARTVTNVELLNEDETREFFSKLPAHDAVIGNIFFNALIEIFRVRRENLKYLVSSKHLSPQQFLLEKNGK